MNRHDWSGENKVIIEIYRMVSAPSPEIVPRYLKYQVGRGSKTLRDFREFREIRENRENRGRVGENRDLSRYFIIIDIDGAAYQFVAPETPGAFQTSIRKPWDCRLPKYRIWAKPSFLVSIIAPLFVSHIYKNRIHVFTETPMVSALKVLESGSRK